MPDYILLYLPGVHICTAQGLLYLPHRRAAKAETSLRTRIISLEPSLLAYTDYGSRGRSRSVLPNIGFAEHF